MSATDEALQNNTAYSSAFDKGQLPLPPAKKLAVVACMDARLHVSKILGLNEGDAHVIRNEEVILIHHTDCGMLTFTDDAVKAQIQKETGVRPAFALEAFSNLDDDVRQSIARIKASPFVPKKDRVRGFVYDVTTGRLNEVQERVAAGVAS